MTLAEVTLVCTQQTMAVCTGCLPDSTIQCHVSPAEPSVVFECENRHRSSARNEKRMEALRECVRMITANAGGCTTPFPFEAAIWLLEEQEELYGGSIPIYKSVCGHFSAGTSIGIPLLGHGTCSAAHKCLCACGDSNFLLFHVFSIWSGVVEGQMRAA